MKRWLLCTALVVLCSAADLRANVIGPGNRQPVLPGQLVGARAVEIVVEVDPNAKHARLVIPTNLLIPAAIKPRADSGRVPAIIAGLALTCAFVSGGFWLVRRGRGRTLAAVLVGLSLLAAGSSVVFADIGIPRQPRQPVQPIRENFLPVVLPADVTIHGKIILETIPMGTKVHLIVNKNMVKGAAQP